VVKAQPGQQIVNRAKRLPDNKIMIESITPMAHQSLILNPDQAEEIRRDLNSLLEPQPAPEAE
jgi:hypothetical protein